MEIADCVFSDNYYFVLGISELLSPALITEHYRIIDIDVSSLATLSPWHHAGRRTIAFIANDLDYYTLKDKGDITFISKRSSLNEILSCFLMKKAHAAYQVKYRLSLREKEVLFCIREGLGVEEIGERLGMNAKTFYAHRRSLVTKLRADNRIALYKNLRRASLCNQSDCDLILW